MTISPGVGRRVIYNILYDNEFPMGGIMYVRASSGRRPGLAMYVPKATRQLPGQVVYDRCMRKLGFGAIRWPPSRANGRREARNWIRAWSRNTGELVRIFEVDTYTFAFLAAM